MTTITTASAQWASRPTDERFVSLLELGAKVGYQRDCSSARVISSRKLQFQPDVKSPVKGLQVVGPQGNAVDLTHWSFGQAAQLAGAPAGYLRKLPAPIAADALNYGMKFDRDVEDIGLLLTRQEEGGVELRAATGPRYGRIWNADIVGALINRFGDGVTPGGFKVPGEFGKDVPVTRENTTIYGSDRDIFVFLADETNRVEMSDRRDGKGGSLARGFFVWNSEVGSQSIGAAFFLFDYVCMNRIIWGAQGYNEIRLRHTASAPDRWLEEVTPVLMSYSNASAAPIEQQIKAAQAKRVDDDLDAFLKNRFSGTQVTAIKAAHEREENRPIESLWDAVTGVTAFAKTVTFQDERVAIERQAGKMLDLVAA